MWVTSDGIALTAVARADSAPAGILATDIALANNLLSGQDRIIQRQLLGVDTPIAPQMHMRR